MRSGGGDWRGLESVDGTERDLRLEDRSGWKNDQAGRRTGHQRECSTKKSELEIELSAMKVMRDMQWKTSVS